MLSKNFTYKAYNNLLMALAFLLPIHDRLVAPVIVLIGLVWILEFNFGEKLKRLRSSRKNRYLLSFGILFVIYLLGSFYSEHIHGKTGALFTLQVKLSLFVFPLLFSTIDVSLLRADIFKKITVAFIWGAMVSSLIILNNAVYHYFLDRSATVFFYTRLSMVHHPSYLSLLYSFAIAILVIWLLKHIGQNTFKRNAVIFLVIYFQVFIVLLSSKAGILGTGMIYLAVIFYYLIKKRQEIRIPLIISGSFLVILLIILILTPPTYERFFAAERALESKLQTDTSQLDGSVARMLIWQSSLEIIKDHPILGVGTGDVNYTLLDKYREHHIVMAEEREYNAHNQYLQTYLATGLAGFLVLIACLLIAFIVAYRRENLLYLLFILIFGFHILVESMLERQAGVVFYSFFNALLFYYTIHGRKEP